MTAANPKPIERTDMKTSQTKPGQTYWKIGTRMAQNNYITNEDSPEYLDHAKCLFACENLNGKQGEFVPIRMFNPCPQPTMEGVDGLFKPAQQTKDYYKLTLADLETKPNKAQHSPHVGPPEPSVFSHELDKAIRERDQAQAHASKLAEALRDMLYSDVPNWGANVKTLEDYDNAG